MKAKLMLVGLALCTFLEAAAHHSLDELFSRDEVITLTGEVTRVR